MPMASSSVPLLENKVAAEQMLADLIKKAELGRVGIRDKFEKHKVRPLAEHLKEYLATLKSKNKAPRYIETINTRLTAMFNGCEFQFTSDFNGAKVMIWLDALREQGTPPNQIPPGDWFTAQEAADLLGVRPDSFRTFIRRNQMPSRRDGRILLYSRGVIEEAQERASRGVNIETANQYLVHLKCFVNWLCKENRIGSNPFVHLEGGSPNVDRRHNRRELEAEELRRLLDTTRKSSWVQQGMTGNDRYHLYAMACGTGFRASALASLTPESFILDALPPVVILAARKAKNRKTKEQPLPPDVADLMRAYLKDKPPGQRIWAGNWAASRLGSYILRHDLHEAGIPYMVEGPEGPLYCDFHALRHTYLTLGGRAGIDLRTLQELAGHSTPELTVRYSHRRLHDLAGAVEKLPNFLPTGGAQEGPQQLQATGTDPSPVRAYRPLTGTPDSGGCRLMVADGGDPETASAGTERNPLNLHGLAGGCGPMMAPDDNKETTARGGAIQMNKLADAFQIEPDIAPDPTWPTRSAGSGS